MASTTNDEWLRMLEEYRGRSTYELEYLKTLDELETSKVDFTWVKSCIAFGAGSGLQEMEFIRRFLPNLREFTAVDSDHDSLVTLQGHAKDGRLPEVETRLVEKTIQLWNGTDDRMDMALLFNLFIHVEPADRRVLIQKVKRCLKPGGIAVIIEAFSTVTTGILRLLERLGNPIDSRMYGEIEKDMISAGFSLVLLGDIKSTLDLSNPGDYVVKYVQLLVDNRASEREVRAAIAEVYSDQAMRNNIRKLGIFKS